MSLLRSPPCGRVWAADQRKRNRAPQKTPLSLSLSLLRGRVSSAGSPPPSDGKGGGECIFRTVLLHKRLLDPCGRGLSFMQAVKSQMWTSNENGQKVILCLIDKHCYSCSNSWRRQENTDMFPTLFLRLYETHSCPSEPPARPSSVRSRSFVRHLLAIKEQHESEKLFLLPPQRQGIGSSGGRETDGEYIQSNWFILLFSLSVGRFRH